MFGRHDQDCESLKIIIMNYFIKPVTFLIFFLFFSCQNEDLTEESHSHLSKSEISFEQFKKETGLSTFETTIKINSHQLGFQYRNPDGSYELSDFILSTDLIKRVVVDERTTYTFQVHPVEESYTDRFFNLTMFYKEGWQSLLIELKPTDENLAQLRDGLTENFEGTMTRLYQSDLPLIGTQGCSTVFITYWHCTGTGQCAGGTCDQCELCVSSDSYTMCGSDPVSGNPVLYISAGPGSGGGPGGSSTTPVNEITIEPNINPSLQPDCNGSIDCINNNNYRLFKDNLSTTQSSILNSNQELNSFFYNYLSANDFSSESIILALELINYSILNNNSSESIQEIMDILDVLDDGMVDEQPVLVEPENPINDMADYLSCFNTSQSAIITIYADQPKTGEHNIFSLNETVGHAFISIKQGTKVKTLGFYPISSIGSVLPNPVTLQPNDFVSTPGIFGNDEGHPYDVSLSVPLTASGLANVIDSIVTVAENNPLYNIGSMNCTDLAILIFNSEAIINIPNCESPSPWSGQTPGTLGEVIRDLDVPPGAGGVKNTNGGNAPINNPN